MEGSKEIDLTKAKISSETEIYTSIILESIKENYKIDDPESHIKNLGFSLEDLSIPKRVEEIFHNLNSNTRGE
jgi:hypothetical protein